VLRGLLVLLSCQLVGELLVQIAGVTVPGPVVGLVLFALWLSALGRRRTTSESRFAEALLEHLQLFFVPAGVGVVAYLDTLGAHALPIVVGLVGSWLVALAVTGWIAAATGRRSRRRIAS
jgi:putative effector of murein hydrolase LrgA (UPF0299 family)